MMKMWVLLVIGMTISTKVPAETSDLVSEALEKTQNVLTNPSELQKVLQSDPKAREADAEVRSLAGSPENVQKLYELASEILGSLVTSTNGDVAKMMAVIEEAQKNPAEFAGRFTQEQLQKLSVLAKQIPTPSVAQKLP
jgi:anion-transporting  ArsA/GET3 family ATPase